MPHLQEVAQPLRWVGITEAAHRHGQRDGCFLARRRVVRRVASLPLLLGRHHLLVVLLLLLLIALLLLLLFVSVFVSVDRHGGVRCSTGRG